MSEQEQDNLTKEFLKGLVNGREVRAYAIVIIGENNTQTSFLNGSKFEIIGGISVLSTLLSKEILYQSRVEKP